MSDKPVEDCADWPFIRDGAVTIFLKAVVLEEAISLVKSEGYVVEEIDCSTDDSVIRGISKALCWEKWFGYEPEHLNLNALNDALRYEPNPERKRLAIVLRNFTVYRNSQQREADAVLDVIEYQSRNHLLHGERLIAFVSSEDPNLHIEPLGGRAANWNEKEWLMSARGD